MIARGCPGSRLLGVLVVLAGLGLWPGAARGEAELNRITEIRVEEAGELSTVTIVGSAPPDYRIVSQARPARLVVELANARAERPRRPRGAVRTGQISSLALGARFVGGEPEARVLIALHGSVAYSEDVVGTSLVLRLVSVEAEGAASRPGVGGPLPGGSRAPEAVEEVIEIEAAEEAAAPAPPPAPSPPAPAEVHVVGPGESLARIAARYGVTARDLVDWNADVVPGRLRIGQQLVVRNPGTITHRVREGDTLSLIAQRYGVTIDDVIGWNPGTLSRDHLRPGSSLVVHTTR